MRVYLIDEGILLTENDKEFESYATVYDKKYGYYDEGQYYVKKNKRQSKMQRLMWKLVLKIHMLLYQIQH